MIIRDYRETYDPFYYYKFSNPHSIPIFLLTTLNANNRGSKKGYLSIAPSLSWSWLPIYSFTNLVCSFSSSFSARMK